MRGTLKELGLPHLLQAFRSAQATGELVLMNGEQYARVFLRQGRPVHAEADGLDGQAVLAGLEGWHIGDFEFLQGVAAPRETIGAEDGPAEPDTHTRIELVPEGAQASSFREAEPFLEEQLNLFIETVSFCLAAYVCDGDGYIVAEAEGKTAPWGLINHIKSTVANLFNNRLTIRRAIIEDGAANAFLQRLQGGGMLVVVADPSATLGALTRYAGKLVELVDG